MPRYFTVVARRADAADRRETLATLLIFASLIHHAGRCRSAHLSNWLIDLEEMGDDGLSHSSRYGRRLDAAPPAFEERRIMVESIYRDSLLPRHLMLLIYANADLTAIWRGLCN